MLISVLGKRTVSGVDKHTHEACSNSVVYFSYEDETVEGLAVGSKWVGAYRCPPEQIIVGKQYELQEHNNYVVKFASVTEE